MISSDIARDHEQMKINNGALFVGRVGHEYAFEYSFPDVRRSIQVGDSAPDLDAHPPRPPALDGSP